ncbi:MAG TPA: hypothetical protein VKA45_09115 [Gaiellaceae bacterium]|nr:hypothetical protein [Gaiellaceae bacterium]
MNDRESQGAKRAGIRGLSYRTLGGIAIAVFVVLFVVLNRRQTEISFLGYEKRTALWVALIVPAAGGFLAGFLLGRRRYRR